MRGHRYIGWIAGLLVAFGVGVVLFANQGTASAAPSPSSDSASIHSTSIHSTSIHSKTVHPRIRNADRSIRTLRDRVKAAATAQRHTPVYERKAHQQTVKAERLAAKSTSQTTPAAATQPDATQPDATQPEQRTLILSAFPAETDAILARTTLDPDPVVVVDGHHYYLGTMGGQQVIVAMTGIGMVNATKTTQTALDYFTPASGTTVDAVVFSGVAGGSGRTQIGDVAVPAQWTADGGATWDPVDAGMLAAASTLNVQLLSADSVADPACPCLLTRFLHVDLGRQPQLFVGGDGSSSDNNNGTAFPAIPFGGAIFGPQPYAAPDRSLLFTGNFFHAIGPFLAHGLLSNLIGLVTYMPATVDAVDQESAAAQQVADAYGIPFLAIRGISDGPGDPLNLPGYPFTFFVYSQLAADNAAIVTEAFLVSWTPTG